MSARIDLADALRCEALIGISSNEIDRFAQRDRRDHQHMLVAKREEVRTLPHRSGLVLVAGAERVQIFPVAQVLRAVEQRRAADARHARSNDLIPEAVLFPNAMIAKIDL